MELLYIICRIAAGDLCEEHRAEVYSPSPMACLHAQAEFATLVPSGWRVARWSCEAEPRIARAANAVDAAIGAVAIGN